ncbi:MAG TPA: DinB family protein [Blastocatellia bacterium]|nr:DinB family protein [Blastocatellia bacterium]
MFTKDGIRALHTWTHERLDLLLRHSAILTPEELVKELPGFGRPSVRDQLAHIIACEEGWVHRLQDIPFNRRQNAGLTVEALQQDKQRVMADTIAYVETLSEAQLNAGLIERPREWGGTLRSPAFILHHVITHAFHHKGQVVAMFRLLGRPAPDTDLQD